MGAGPDVDAEVAGVGEELVAGHRTQGAPGGAPAQGSPAATASVAAEPAAQITGSAPPPGQAPPYDDPPPYEETLERVIGGFHGLIREGVAAGVFRDVSPGHLTQTLIGATVYHFASADLGEEILGAPNFSADQVRASKRELKALVRSGIVKES